MRVGRSGLNGQCDGVCGGCRWLHVLFGRSGLYVLSWGRCGRGGNMIWIHVSGLWGLLRREQVWGWTSGVLASVRCHIWLRRRWWGNDGGGWWSGGGEGMMAHDGLVILGAGVS